MNPKLRAFLEENGLLASASEQEAWELYDRLLAEGVVPKIDPGVRTRSAAHPAPADPPVPAAPEPEPVPEPAAASGEVAAAIRAEVARQRQGEIARLRTLHELLDLAGLPRDDEFGRSLIDDQEMDAARAGTAILARLRDVNPPIGQTQVGREASEKLGEAIIDGLRLRSGQEVTDPAPGAREFRGRSLLEISREVLEANGIPTRSLSRRDIAARALSLRATHGPSTSDFPHIFSGLVNSTLQAAYAEWPATWRQFVATTSAMDFKEIHSIRLSAAPDLLTLGEHGEYQTASFSEAKESYRVVTKGVRLPITRTMIINDDLRAFTRIPQLFGAAARRMEADAVYDLITANAAMADGKTLFHADHKNLASGDAAAAISSASLGAARAAMRRQTGLNGEVIDIQPAFLLCPVEMETTAEVLLRSTALPDDHKSAAVYNPWQGRLTPIADPHLTGTAWYLLAHPQQVPFIECAWLEGEEQPYIEEQIDFDSDSLMIKVRHDFGAGIIDHVGAYKNVGK
ncbi:MAG: Mu-like prophage major head subunit gpT family protein [Desulfobulbus sp.]|jgi:hypothetical protein